MQPVQAELVQQQLELDQPPPSSPSSHQRPPSFL
jgi:hypothetical protein